MSDVEDEAQPPDDGGELDPEEAESLFHDRIATTYPGDHDLLSADQQADFMRRYNEQAG